uniref:Uncharacterized protein n=1 Tax=Avena sativa TaxID=4498 RepID=A0ACD5XRA2_AVESA
MELSKLHDGFVVEDVLTIKAQVQVIREKADRPFRCLDGQYRRELVRVYLSNVEQICRRFIDERRSKLCRLIEDRLRWSSFNAFWLGMDPSVRQHMTREKTDTILKVLVKHFFIEKEVTSTLVMDSLHSGLKALEYQSKNKKGVSKLTEIDVRNTSMVLVEQDMFVLADDVLLLLERATLDTLPHQPLPAKDEKSSQNRTKDSSSGDDFNKDSIERDDRRLIELGWKTLEFFALAHIFSRIEVAYQEAVALKRQEELIREEEAAGLAEIELKAKRSAAEKEKRIRKKQAKQKKNSRKNNKGKNERVDMKDIGIESCPSDDRIPDDFSSQTEEVTSNADNPDEASDVSDDRDDNSEVLHGDFEDRESSPVNWETDASETQGTTVPEGGDVQNEQAGKRTSFVDDSSSTCSSDSVPSVMNGSSSGGAWTSVRSSSNRGNNRRNKDTDARTGLAHGGSNSAPNGIFGSSNSKDMRLEAEVCTDPPAFSFMLRNTSFRKENSSLKPGFTFGTVKPESLNQYQWREEGSQEASCSSSSNDHGVLNSSMGNEPEKLNLNGRPRSKQLLSEISTRFTPYQPQGLVGDEFPHLDIINDLLDEELSDRRKVLQPGFARQFSLPNNVPNNASMPDYGMFSDPYLFDQSEQYYDEDLPPYYSDLNGAPQGLRDRSYSQFDLPSYSSSQFDDMAMSQWPYSRADNSSMPSFGADMNAYPYQLRDYPTSANGASSRYPSYHPANGP